MPPKKPTLDDLPMFASDQELAIAIVGKDRASYWLKAVLPTLRGFPRKDEAHAGWPVPLVKKFYDGYLGVIHDFASKGASGAENLDVWKRKPRFSPEAKAEKTVAAPITAADLEDANRRRDKRLQKAAEREARLAAIAAGDEPMD